MRAAFLGKRPALATSNPRNPQTERRTSKVSTDRLLARAAFERAGEGTSRPPLSLTIVNLYKESTGRRKR